MTQQVDISLIKAGGTGPVISAERGLMVDTTDPDNSVLSGSFDANSGQLAINIPTIGKLVIQGLPTIHDVGYGPAGMPGDSGRDGIDGLMGNNGGRGSDGCPGARGQEGTPGRQGPDGRRGPRGATGATGATGSTGTPGVVAVFVQQRDPIENEPQIPAGAIWVRV